MIRRTPRSRFTIVVLMMLCLTLITIDTKANGGGAISSVRSRARDLFVPVQGRVGGVADPVVEFADAVINAGDLKRENERLREQAARQQGQLLQQADAERERQALLDLNRLDVVADIPKVTSRVVNMAPSNLQLTVEIDRGSDAGVAKDMPVVNGAGLVGRVESASARRAVVRLITDPGVNVAVRLGSDLNVSVKGNGFDAELLAELVKPDQPVGPGEVVVTSGQGQRFPPGIPLGTVSTAKVLPGVAFQDVNVRPAVDFDRMEFVQVLLWRGTDTP